MLPFALGCFFHVARAGFKNYLVLLEVCKRKSREEYVVWWGKKSGKQIQNLVGKDSNIPESRRGKKR